MTLDALTPATTKETIELLRALLSNAVLMREALERIDKRLDEIRLDVSDISLDMSAISPPRLSLHATKP